MSVGGVLGVNGGGVKGSYRGECRTCGVVVTCGACYLWD